MCYTGLCTYEDHLGDCSVPSSIHQKVRNRYGFDICIFGNLPIKGYEEKINPEIVKFVKEHEDLIDILHKDFLKRRKKKDWEVVGEHPWKYLKKYIS